MHDTTIFFNKYEKLYGDDWNYFCLFYLHNTTISINKYERGTEVIKITFVYSSYIIQQYPTISTKEYSMEIM